MSVIGADLTDISTDQGFSPLEKETASLFDWSRAETYKEISGSRRVTVAVTDDGCVGFIRYITHILARS